MAPQNGHLLLSSVVLALSSHTLRYLNGRTLSPFPAEAGQSGTPNLFRNLRAQAVFFRRHGADEVLRGRPRQIPWTTNIRAPTFRNLLVAAIASDVGTFMS